MPVSDTGVRAVARRDHLGAPPYSEHAQQFVRRYLSPAPAAALDALGEWMARAGMPVRRDGAANLNGRHDGALGVMLGTLRREGGVGHNPDEAVDPARKEFA
jgi:hypothetical protein